MGHVLSLDEMAAVRAAQVGQATSRKKRGSDYLGALLFLLLSPVIFVAVIVVITFHLVASVFLHLAAWCCWNLRGRYVLFVYSDSPIWHDYIEENILPRLGERVVVLNWSHRRRWRLTLAVLVFRYFGGHRLFNPMAVVFRPLRLAKTFRFYEPFRDFKHGESGTVAKMEHELFELLDEIVGRRAA
jgi:hypothetical protein